MNRDRLVVFLLEQIQQLKSLKKGVKGYSLEDKRKREVYDAQITAYEHTLDHAEAGLFEELT